MAVILTPEEIAIYRETARRQWERSKSERSRLEERAWKAARKAARLLRQRFGATRVVIFGSLSRPGYINRWSDIDLAAWGISDQDTFRAIGAVMDLETDFEINLVDINTVRPSLLQTIEKEGIDI